MNIDNFFENLPDTSKDEITQILAKSNNFRMERIISEGQSSPPDFWYVQEENEWVMILEGDAEIEFADSLDDSTSVKLIKMESGDYILIPALKKHRVKSTSQAQKTIWLAVFFS